MKISFNYWHAFLILICFAIFLLTSCHKYRCVATGDYLAGNGTDKEIVVRFIIYWMEEDDIQILHPSASSNRIRMETMSYREILMYMEPYFLEDSLFRYIFTPDAEIAVDICKNQEPYFREYAVYNLTDTTSVRQGYNVDTSSVWQGCWMLGRNRDGLIDRFVEVKREYDPKKSEEIHYTYHLTVTDSLLSLMQKDTSMLRLFPDYYGGE